MDTNHFARLARIVAVPDSRRRLLRALAALPVAGGLLDILDPDDVAGNGRRKRRVKKHKHGKGRRRKKRKPKTCKAEPASQTCAGKCGSVINNCRKAVACGTCGCTGSDQCASGQVCDGGTCAACNVTCAGTAAECGATLQAAIEAASAGARLRLCPGAYQGGFTIGKALTLVGAGQGSDPQTSTILDGNTTQRVLLVQGGTSDVTLEHLRVARGEVGSGLGGGILHRGKTLVMQDCTVAANRGRLGGGLLADNGSPLQMTRCAVLDNVAPFDGTSTAGGGLVVSPGTTLTDCTITGNTAEQGHGGGILAISTVGEPVTLAGATVIQRNTAHWGGGIFSSQGAMLIGATCRITGNQAAAGLGGGIYREGGTVTLQGPAPSPIVTANCHENCAVQLGDPIPGCAAGGTCPP